MNRILLSILLLSCIAPMRAQDSIPTKKPFLKGVMGRVTHMINAFNEVDTAYIEPQHYNFTVMAQGTMNYEGYRIKSKEGNSVWLAPENSFRVGPYVGWQWIFYGYTLGIGHRHNRQRTEWDLSAYSSRIGVDIFYRKSGNDFKIRSVHLVDHPEAQSIKDVNFSGLSVDIKGFNIYYIVNHKKFSYPAAFGQSTCQKRSAGSLLAGIGYSRHQLEFDYESFDDVLKEHLPSYRTLRADSGLMFRNIAYTDISISGGYAYNYVFARNWLLAASLSVAVAYKQSTGDIVRNTRLFRDFSFENINIDGVGRFGLVWNNTRWYAGASAIVHSYNYRKPQFSANNIFGNINVYFGVNFGKKKKYKNQ